MILPVDWLERPDAARLATAFRRDLQSIARIVDVRPPVYVVVTGLESEPGFLEFAGRMKETFRTRRRCGFYLPGEPGDTAGLVHRGLIWFSGWYQTWILHLMANDPTNHKGNNALFTFGSHIRRFRRRLPELLATAIAAPGGGENIPLHGCYFAATGPSPDTDGMRSRGLSEGGCWTTPPPHAGPCGRSLKTLLTDGAALQVGIVGGSRRF